MNVVLLCFHFRWWLWPFFISVFGEFVFNFPQIWLRRHLPVVFLFHCGRSRHFPFPLPPSLFSIWWLHYIFGVSWLFRGGLFSKAAACCHLASVRATRLDCCRGHSPLSISCPNKTKNVTHLRLTSPYIPTFPPLTWGILLKTKKKSKNLLSISKRKTTFSPP